MIKAQHILYTNKSLESEIILNRLTSKCVVNDSTGCIEWTGANCVGGYGRIRFRENLWLTHRVSWVIFNGDIPEGMCICHKCDNPKCINPNHLFLGTRSENSIDMTLKGRRHDAYKYRTHCKHGHEYNEENTAYSTVGKCTYRRCKQCGRNRTAVFRSKLS